MTTTLSCLALAAALAAPLRAEEAKAPADATKAAEAAPAPSLYDRLGGLKAISMLTDDFIDRLVADKTLNANPAINAGRKSSPAPYLKVQVSILACQVTGGPCKYTGKDMKSAHAHLGITEAEWAAMRADLDQSLAKFKVPAGEQKEFIAIIESTKPDIVVAAKK